MTFMTYILIAVMIFALAALITRVMMRVGVRAVPNHRSSHQQSIPNSGGMAIAAGFVFGMTGFYLLEPDAASRFGLDGVHFALFMGLSVLVAGMAFIDDAWDVLPLSKLIAQCIAALVFVIFIGRIEALDFLGLGVRSLGFWGYGLSVLWIVFFMNAFNFMDGINGIAGGGAVVVALFLGSMALIQGSDFVALSCLCLGAAVSGFLIYNFPSGRIFMGDTGSQYIGFVFAGLAIIGTAMPPGGATSAKLSILLVPVLFFPFIYDVVLTLVYRSVRRQNIMQAHRDHLYQIAIKLGASHVAVTGLYMGLFVLCGLVALVVQRADAVGRFWILGGLVLAFSAGASLVYRVGMKGGVVVPLKRRGQT
jgi:UDP-N-acetylmuramyl pentapeptide phosphotransferase/UDP-N-acetylglucosamine-1-phosphate transferase